MDVTGGETEGFGKFLVRHTPVLSVIKCVRCVCVYESVRCFPREALAQCYLFEPPAELTELSGWNQPA